MKDSVRALLDASSSHVLICTGYRLVVYLLVGVCGDVNGILIGDKKSISSLRPCNKVTGSATYFSKLYLITNSFTY